MSIVPYGYTIFCDDIRQEISGKFSLIGIYRNDMIIHGDYPFQLPKFFMYITYVDDPLDHPETIEITVQLPGDPENKPSIQGTVSLGGTAPKDQSEPEPGTLLESINIISFTPLILKQDGLIRVRANRDGQIVKLKSLQVMKSTPQTDKAS